jgi:hypothetical protein
MRSLFSFIMLPFISIGALAGCAAAGDSQDELTGGFVDETLFDGKVDNTVGSDAYTYFEVTTDLRRCPSPLCGGWFVQRLNRSTTVCHDGRRADLCYAPVLDWSESNLSADQRDKLLDASRKDALSGGVYAIARGRFEPTNTTPRPELGRFVITEAWIAEGNGVAEGAFVKLKDNGLRCFAAPCPNLTEITLNRPVVTAIAEVDWTPAGLSERQIEGAIEAMYGPDGILVAGYRYIVYENRTAAKGRIATNVYRRLSNADATEQ